MAPAKSPTATFNLGRPGVAALTTVLGLALVISLMAITTGLISYFEIQIAYSQAKSQEAYLAAQSGAQDALLRISRDKTYPSATNCNGSYSSPSCSYSLAVGSDTANVTVTNIDTAVGTKQIVSTGTALNRKRRIQVDLVADVTTGAVTITSWKEVVITP